MDRQQLIKLGLLAIALVGLVYVINLYSKKQNVVNNGHMDGFYGDSLEGGNELYEEPEESNEDSSNNDQDENNTDNNQDSSGDGDSAESQEGFQNGAPQGVMASDPMGQNEVFQFLDTQKQQSGEFGLSGNQYPKDCFPKDQLSPGELLPGDANSKWAQSVPAGQGELGDQNFLTAGHHVGVNTVGQTLRNANRQLRSEPPNPQVKVSPWLQTTIEADTNRRPMEIGGCQ